MVVMKRRAGAQLGCPGVSVSPNQWFAGLVVGVCGVMLIRMLLGDRRRDRVDAAARRLGHHLRRRGQHLWHWRRRRDESARLAEEAIQRARRARADKDGNVIRPEAFKGPRKPH